MMVTDKKYGRFVVDHFERALKEDGSDLTSAILLKGSERVRAALIAKESGVLAGMEELNFFLKGRLKLVKPLKDGVPLRRGMVLGVLEGRAGEILKLERIVLNFLQRMSGVATLTHEYVRRAGRDVKVCSTRKTLWGLLDKKAVVVGGGGTHRLNLSDAVLVKDTHLDLLGHDFKKLGARLMGARNLGRFVEIEVESVRDGLQVLEILRALREVRRIPCFVMLDNMKVVDVRKFVRLARGSGILVEASGGIMLANIRKYAETGVERISVGALTHSARALDISMKILRRGKNVF